MIFQASETLINCNSRPKRPTFWISLFLSMLLFTEPISFEATNQVQSVENGSGSHTLTCKVTGNPKPRVTWNVHGNIMRSGYDDGKYRVTADGLVIRNITQNDKGAYKCKATQIDDDITEFQDIIIQLRVQRK